ncbi:MAG: MogA/MoaB family molybdenum cofactor biosynthesis protein [Candidatus Hadarchaeales archaeon]
MSFEEHRKRAQKKLGIAVLVVSDTRAKALKEGRDIDVSGKLIEARARKAGHFTVRAIVPDERREIVKKLREVLKRKDIHAIIISGGTGVARRDVTIETVEPMYEKSLPGFGEILRRIGYEKVGTPALLTRASAGTIKCKPVFCLPGAPNAVKEALKLILPDLPHLVMHASE